LAQQTDIDGIVTASLSETGPTRADNQDLYGDFRHASGGRLLILADGMGGHRGGALASRSCVDAFFTIFDDQVGSPEDWLRRTFEFANDRVYETARTDPELKGMGTTGVALLFAPDGTAWVGWVGDSRLYRLRDGELELLTEDHSLVAEWVRIGVLTPEEAAEHPRRSELTRAIGISVEIEPDVRAVEVLPADRFLLCSDGLHGVVHERQIKVVLGSESPQTAVRTLVERAVELGGPDNITVQIAVVAAEADEFGAGTFAPATPKTLPRSTKIVPPMMEPEPEEEPDSSLHIPSLVGGMIIAGLLLAGGYAWLTTFGPGARAEGSVSSDAAVSESRPPEGTSEPRATELPSRPIRIPEPRADAEPQRAEPEPERSEPAQQLEAEAPTVEVEAELPQPLPAQPPAATAPQQPETVSREPETATQQAETVPQEPEAVNREQETVPRHVTSDSQQPEPAAEPGEASPPSGVSPPAAELPAETEPSEATTEPTPGLPQQPEAVQPPPASRNGTEEETGSPQGAEPELVADADLAALEDQGIDVSELEPDADGFVYVPVPVPVPTSKGFDLPEAAHSFVDTWMQAAAGRDYAAYRALGFPESPQEFEATYGQWEAFKLRKAEIEESRTTDERLYLHLVLSYAFHDPNGRWRTEDEHRLVLRRTPAGLRYEARWK
jgi:serine/threonine protein phosphatase PrpC